MAMQVGQGDAAESETAYRCYTYLLTGATPSKVGKPMVHPRYYIKSSSVAGALAACKMTAHKVVSRKFMPSTFASLMSALLRSAPDKSHLERSAPLSTVL